MVAPSCSPQGRIFVDRSGTLFDDVLSLLRDGPEWRPPEDRCAYRRCTITEAGRGRQPWRCCISVVAISQYVFMFMYSLNYWNQSGYRYYEMLIFLTYFTLHES